MWGPRRCRLGPFPQRVEEITGRGSAGLAPDVPAGVRPREPRRKARSRATATLASLKGSSRRSTGLSKRGVPRVRGSRGPGPPFPGGSSPSRRARGPRRAASGPWLLVFLRASRPFGSPRCGRPGPGHSGRFGPVVILRPTWAFGSIPFRPLAEFRGPQAGGVARRAVVVLRREAPAGSRGPAFFPPARSLMGVGGQ